MAEIGPRDTGGRGLESAGRYIADVRQAIAPRGGTVAENSSGNVGTVSRYLAPVRNAIAPRSAGGSAFQSIAPASAAGSSSAAGAAVGPYRYYPGDDAFSTLADLFTRTFGADNPAAGTTQYGVVPTQVGGSGSSNSILLLIVLALAGLGIWYFYFRKKGGADA